VREVARYLGNTPAVCRASYIDPRVFDRFDGGLTVGGVFERLPDDPADWPENRGRSKRPYSTSSTGVNHPRSSG
jgi:DNA topoisomerase I